MRAVDKRPNRETRAHHKTCQVGKTNESDRDAREYQENVQLARCR